MKFSIKQLLGVMFILCIIFTFIHNSFFNYKKPTNFPTYFDPEVSNFLACVLTPFYIDFCLLGIQHRWPIYTNVGHLDTFHPFAMAMTLLISYGFSIAFHIFVIRLFLIGMWNDWLKPPLWKKIDDNWRI